jgi:hypothetical protein
MWKPSKRTMKTRARLDWEGFMREWSVVSRRYCICEEFLKFHSLVWRNILKFPIFLQIPTIYCIMHNIHSKRSSQLSCSSMLDSNLISRSTKLPEFCNHIIRQTQWILQLRIIRISYDKSRTGPTSDRHSFDKCRECFEVAHLDFGRRIGWLSGWIKGTFLDTIEIEWRIEITEYLCLSEVRKYFMFEKVQMVIQQLLGEVLKKTIYIITDFRVDSSCFECSAIYRLKNWISIPKILVISIIFRMHRRRVIDEYSKSELGTLLRKADARGEAR